MRCEVCPALIGPRNCEAFIGQPWRWVRDTARRLGVPVLTVGGKSFVRAPEMLAALEREAASQPVQAIDCDTEDAIAERWGLRWTSRHRLSE